MAPALTVDLPLALDEDCVACAHRLEERLADHRGVVAIGPGAAGAALRVSYDPDLCSLECVSDAARELRIELAGRYEHHVLGVGGMDCYDCAQTIERSVSRLPGVSHAAVNFPAGRMSVEYETGTVALDAVAERVRRLGYEVMLPGAGAREVAAGAVWWRRREALTGLAALLLCIGLVLDQLGGVPHGVAIAVYTAAILIGGVRVARSGLVALRATHRPDINLLMTIAVVGAAAIGAWVEAALVVVLFSLGETLEGRAVDRARRELAGLVSLAPDVARVRRANVDADGEQHVEEVEIAAAELVIGDVLVVRPGERMAADGVVAEGSSAVDQAPITGESTPVDKQAGDGVFAGTLNGQGALLVRVSSAPGDTTLAKTGRLVADAQARKSPSERWVSSFARIYTPLVMGAAVLVATVPLAFGVDFSDAFYSALALLILACPCALVISTPVSIVSALGRASAAGVLVKGGAHLETAAAIHTVAFDKTGTLTEGRPAVAQLEALTGDDEQLLTIAASLEQGSEHPLARAILNAARERGLRLQAPTGFQALTGLGARAILDGATVTIGNPRLFGEDALPPAASAAVQRLQDLGQTAVLVARDDEFLGAIGLADRPRPQAAEAIAALRRLGITRTVLLTGDNRAVADAIATELGVSETRAELLPQDKAAAIAALGVGIAMVGDGVNDAPALAAADLGIAMGSAGSDAAIEVADIALMGDEPRKVAGLIGLARWTKAIVRQNIVFALAVKAVAVVVLAAGALPLWAAVASDVGASLIVIANGLRLLRAAPHGRLRGMPILDPAARTAATPPARPAAVTLPIAPPAPAASGEDCACCASSEPPALSLTTSTSEERQ